MTICQNESYDRQTLHLDNAVYSNCTFINCLLLYSGGVTVISECKMTDCKVQYLGAAERALVLWEMFKKMQVNAPKIQSSLVS